MSLFRSLEYNIATLEECIPTAVLQRSNAPTLQRSTTPPLHRSTAPSLHRSEVPPVNASEVMRSLKSMGTAQNVKVYKRHGAGDNLFGVSFANLKTLKRQIKVDHALATELWKTGNTDAMSLATMIADPAELTAASADDWLKDVSYISYQLK